jgi:hypothetical protein
MTNQNLIINGAMTVAQKTMPITSIDSSQVTIDRWKLEFNGSTDAVVAVDQSDDVPVGSGFSKSLKVDCVTVEAAVGATESIALSTTIEGQDLQHLMYGEGRDAEKVTLSFWVKSPQSGFHNVALYAHDKNVHSVKQFEIEVADDWEFHEVTFRRNRNEAINDDSNPGLSIIFPLVAGNDYVASRLNAWDTGYQFVTTAGLNLLNVYDNDFCLTGVKLEVGRNATEFEHESHAQTLARCYRFNETFAYTAIGGETSLSGFDDNGNSLAYVAGSLDVFLNGAALAASAYVATTETSVTGLAALSASDVVTIVATHAQDPVDAYPKAQSDAKYQPLDGDLTTIAGLAPTDGNVITGNGTTWTSEATASGGGSNSNLIINGGMSVSQRGSVNVVTTDIYGGPDRYKARTSTGVARWTVSQDSSEVPTGFGTSLKADITTADATVDTGDFEVIEQRIEAQDLQHLDYGAAGALTMTCSFWVRSPKSGIHCVSLYGADGGNRTYVREYSVTTADTWENISVSFPGDVSGQIDNDNGLGLSLRWALMCGSSNQGTADAWGSVNTVATSSQVNCCDNVANNFYLTGVKLEAGSIATNFVHENYGDTLRKCMRYHYELEFENSRLMMGCYDATIALGDAQYLPVPMRATPVITTNSSSYWRAAHNGTVHDTTITMGFTTNGTDMWFPSMTMDSGSQGQTYWALWLGTGTKPVIYFDAEL